MTYSKQTINFQEGVEVNTKRIIKNINGKDELAVSYSQIETFMQCPYKWKLGYIDCLETSGDTEALKYGSAVHETLEWFFKNGRKASAEALIKQFEMRATNLNIPFVSVESQIESMKDAVTMVEWITSVFDNNNFENVYHTPFDVVLRNSAVVGVEEPFALPYKLPCPVSINGKEYDHVVLNGSIDLHLKHTKGDIIVDWKSGRKIFDNNKLKNNLQHPIYSFVVMRQNNNTLPYRNYYLFTRTREYQSVNVDMERVKSSVSMLNTTFSNMYKRGTSYKPVPTPLCYWCDFKDKCPHRSSYEPKQTT